MPIASVPGGRYYRPWIERCAPGWRRDIDDLIAAALAEIIAADAREHLGLFHGALTAAGMHVGAHVLDGGHGVPLRLRRGEVRAPVRLHTRAEILEWQRAWTRHVARLHAGATAYSVEVHARFDLADYTAPVLGTDGQPLTGQAEITARKAVILDWLNHWYPDSDKPARLAGLRAAVSGLPADRLSTDLAAARGQLLDRLDDAAAEVRAWLLDDPDGLGAGPATVGQEAALRLLEARRQMGRRSLRRSTTLTTAQAVAAQAVAQVRGVGIEDAPAWQTSTGAVLSGGRLALTASAPSETRWSRQLRAANPAPAVASKSSPDIGVVALDHVDAPAGWTVTAAPRPSPHALDLDVTIAQTAAPEAGIVELTLTARNACGPRDLVVAITVPAPAGDAG